MEKTLKLEMLAIAVAGFLALGVCFTGCGGKETANNLEPAGRQLDLDAKSVRVYPVGVDKTGVSQEFAFDVSMAEVIGMLLGRGGMKPEVSHESIPVTPADSLSDMENKIRKFHTNQKIDADYTLFVSFTGKPAAPRRILGKTCIVITDPAGNIIWSRQDTEFPDGAPDCPMAACVYVIHALRKVSDLQDFERKDAPRSTPMEELMKMRSGVPKEQEIKEMDERWKAALNLLKDATITVYPFHIRGSEEGSGQIAETLAKELEKSIFGRAFVTKTVPDINVQGNPNELRVLWDTAKAFRSYLQEHPADTDYVLLVDIGGLPTVQYVHVILCEGNGQWVMVDIQNSHHRAFKRVNPDSVADCGNLALIRLLSRVQGID